MTHHLSSRMRTALLNLREECDYEDGHKGGTDNFILRGALGAGIGPKTLTDLEHLGFIENGPSRWHDETGYRITAAGRAAIE